MLIFLTMCHIARVYLASSHIRDLKKTASLHVQVVTHTLRRTVHDRRKNKTGKRVPCSASDRNLLHGAVCSSMQLYLGTTNACKFACYLVSFISSAESVAAWDRTMRRPASTAHQRANCSAPVASSSQPISCAPDPVRMLWYHHACFVVDPGP